LQALFWKQFILELLIDSIDKGMQNEILDREMLHPLSGCKVLILIRQKIIDFDQKFGVFNQFYGYNQSIYLTALTCTALVVELVVSIIIVDTFCFNCSESCSAD